VEDNSVDFKIHDGYVAFSSEIVRLALLAPAVFVFLIDYFYQKKTGLTGEVVDMAVNTLIAALAFMAAAIMFALAHRYIANDFMSELILVRRKGGSMKGSWRTRWATLTIFAAPACLAIGVALMFVVLIKVFPLAR
jgi:hypothetical protein